MASIDQSAELILSILSPERRLLEKEKVQEVTLPGSEGQIQILDGHAPMIGTLETGIFSYRSLDGTLHTGMVSEGFFEVNENGVNVMAEHLELQGEVNVESAKKAQAEAEEALKDAELDPHHFSDYQNKLQRALIRQQLASHDHNFDH
jgi:F-type H+-transporting ATPase subunit epsilon